MPDISMCYSGDCPRRRLCYRFRAVPNEFRQSYADFFGLINECTRFWPITTERVDTIAVAEERNERIAQP